MRWDHWGEREKERERERERGERGERERERERGESKGIIHVCMYMYKWLLHAVHKHTQYMIK